MWPSLSVCAIGCEQEVVWPWTDIKNSLYYHWHTDKVMGWEISGLMSVSMSWMLSLYITHFNFRPSLFGSRMKFNWAVLKAVFNHIENRWMKRTWSPSLVVSSSRFSLQLETGRWMGTWKCCDITPLDWTVWWPAEYYSRFGQACGDTNPQK